MGSTFYSRLSDVSTRRRPLAQSRMLAPRRGFRSADRVSWSCGWARGPRPGLLYGGSVVRTAKQESEIAMIAGRSRRAPSVTGLGSSLAGRQNGCRQKELGRQGSTVGCLHRGIYIGDDTNIVLT